MKGKYLLEESKVYNHRLGQTFLSVKDWLTE